MWRPFSSSGIESLFFQVIVTSDTVLSVRATVLLGQILHLTTLLLPHEIGAVSQCLPELAEHIATTNYVGVLRNLVNYS